MTQGNSDALRKHWLWLGAGLGLLLGLGCRPSATPPANGEPAGPPWFADVTADVGLRFVHDAGPLPTDRYYLPQTAGSGAAFFDFDQDGRLDIYLIHNGGPKAQSTNRLFRQTKDGRFEDVSAGSGLDVAGQGMGAAVGDVNNDGWPDLLLTEYGRVRLFVNQQGSGRFVDVTREAGLDNPHWATSACFFDYDRDGWLDLVVVNYVEYDPTKLCHHRAGMPDYCGPGVFPGTASKLFRNRGPAGPAGAARFEDVTLASGLSRVPGPGLGVACADFTGDGWPDIFVANDGKPNRLWINQRNGTFTEEAGVRAVAYNALGEAHAGMGVALGDADGDGLLDLFVTHLTSETHALWRQESRGQFRDVTAAARVASGRWRGTGFGTIFGDFDHDGALDLALVNGRVERRDESAGGKDFWEPYRERNQLFTNEGAGRFRDISPQNGPFSGTAGVSRGLACADFDNDGALDLLVTAIAGPARLYRNVAPNRGHWLLVRAVDPRLGGRDAHGAEVTVRAGGRSWVRLVSPAHSYLCSNDPRAHFGLGASATVEAVEVLWPDGLKETFAGGSADRILVLRRGEGKP